MADIRITKTDGVGFMQIRLTRGVDFFEKFQEKKKQVLDNRNFANLVKKN